MCGSAALCQQASFRPQFWHEEEARLNKTLTAAEDLPLPTREEVAAFLEKAQNIKKLSRDEQKRVIADLVDEIVIRDRGDKYITFRVFSAPMVEAGRVELPSENPSTRLSTSVSGDFTFPLPISLRQDIGFSSFINPARRKA